MTEFKNINEILDFAIVLEQEAVEFYTRLAANSQTADMRLVFESFASEEMNHKAKLMEIKLTGIFTLSVDKVADLKMADYIVSEEARPDMTYPEALSIAMKKEKAAFKLYTRLSQKAPTKPLREIFAALAVEESRHKLRFEIEYDEFVLREN
jgi:rubrerythrin